MLSSFGKFESTKFSHPAHSARLPQHTRDPRRPNSAQMGPSRSAAMRAANGDWNPVWHRTVIQAPFITGECRFVIMAIPASVSPRRHGGFSRRLTAAVSRKILY